MKLKNASLTFAGLAIGISLLVASCEKKKDDKAGKTPAVPEASTAKSELSPAAPQPKPAKPTPES